MLDRRSDWVGRAVRLLEAEAASCDETPLLQPCLLGSADIVLYLKDESCHPSGSLKHRLARSLILAAICDGRVVEGAPLVDASSGSTAVSEAYYAQMLGLDFYAVVPRSTSQRKLDAISRYGGKFRFVDDPSTICAVAAELAREVGGHFLDQFTNAERAVDWRRNNIAESIFRQMAGEPPLVWIVMSAGTGGTSATIGRYIRYSGAGVRLCVPDVDYSAFYKGWVQRDRTVTCARGSRIEGIGRPRVEPSFLFDVVDAMVLVPDPASIAACRILSERLGRRVGASTGTNLLGSLWAAEQMRQGGQQGSIVTLICDGGDRYADTYFNDDWLAAEGLDIAPYLQMVGAALDGEPLHDELFAGQTIR
jgi:cysteine synthase A